MQRETLNISYHLISSLKCSGLRLLSDIPVTVWLEDLAAESVLSETLGRGL